MTFFQYEEQKAGVGPLLATLPDSFEGGLLSSQIETFER